MSDKARILIVDDEPNVRLVFRTTLESSDHELAVADDGVAALEELGRSGADLVLLDLQMAVLGGMETLRKIREGGNDVPVVIVTAHGSVPHAVEAMKLGAIDFLAKPLSPDSLRKVVAEVLARHVTRPGSCPGYGGASSAPVTTESEFAANMIAAKRALNRRGFDEAEVFLKQAVALEDASAEAHNLMGVLRELRGEHDASYRSYKAAIKADGRYEPAQNNMTRYYERFTFGRSEVPIDLGEGD